MAREVEEAHLINALRKETPRAECLSRVLQNFLLLQKRRKLGCGTGVVKRTSLRKKRGLKKKWLAF